MLFGLLAFILLLPLAGLVYQWLGVRRDLRRWPAPGVCSHGLHVWQSGAGAPSVVLEAGIAASSLSWHLVRQALSAEMTVLSYDRSGYGWSASRPTPRTLPTLVDELHEVLQAARLPGPRILVGHSFGGLLLRHYAARYPGEVAALVLVDSLEPFEWHPAGPSQLRMLGRGVALARRGALLARLGVVRLALDLLLSGSRFLPQLLSKVSSGQGSAVSDRLVGELRKLPPELWPAMRAHWCLPRSFRTLAEYLERLPEACAAPLDDSALADLPLIVISAERTHPAVIEAHRRTARLSSRGEHVVARGSGHWVQLDRPDSIVAAVRKLSATLK